MKRNLMFTKLRLLGMAVLLLSQAGWLGLAISAYAQDEQAAPPAGGRGAAEPQGDPKVMPPQRELAMKIKGSFTIVGVGDLIIRNPLGQLAEPGFQGVIKHMR